MLRWLWLLALVLVQGCAGSPLAEQFERSFDPELAGVTSSPPASPQPASPPSPEPTAAKDNDDAPEDDEVQARQSDPLPDKPVKAPEQTKEKDPVPEVVSAPTPRPSLPYRVTIRLSGADPSAPAEAVTRALRDASVAFSVERIEAVDDPTAPGEDP
jgi:hypothetical protein